jgi:subtilisin family serine protease
VSAPDGVPRPTPTSTMRNRLPVALGTVATLIVSWFSSSPAAADDPVDNVDPAVFAQLAAEGETTFWAVLSADADLGPASDIDDRSARGTFVVDELTDVAEESQAALIARLDELGVPYESFWVVNAVEITADETVLSEVAARPEVEQVVADRVYEIPEPVPGAEDQAVQAVEWNIDRIRAPLVWSTFGTRGDGIVVANIDTGVQFDHPALRAQYRGNLGGGSLDHDYNWFDPSRVCGNPSLAPCDNNGHGTHTMGTMVGDDGDPGANQVGVAPHARWIAAKGCETSTCSLSALLAAGQWVLAPTDLSGANPRPDLRPHVVNSSWGGARGDVFYQATVEAWTASGIFPAFSNGNGGPNCNTSTSPGDYPATFSAGAFDINDNIASFSSRGPSVLGGDLKPNIAAPGVNVRSARPNNTYGSLSGTSMASPHVAGTVALMWAAAPTIVGDIAATRALLDNTAIDTPNLTCGGSDDDNNVFGEGRLDAFAAVDQAPRGGAGTLTGTVTSGVTGSPIAGARVEAAGPVTRTATTNSNGVYTLTLPVGTYDVTAQLFGFLSAGITGVVIAEGATTTQDFTLQQAPAHAVSGHVRDEGQATAGATVTIVDTPIPPATTDATGFYAFPMVPEGEYDVRVDAGQCAAAQTQHLVVDGDETLDFDLTRRPDSFGYFCRVVPADYIEATEDLALTGDSASTSLRLPFSFPFYGQSYSTVHVSTNGSLNFLAASTTGSNVTIPSAAAPNAAIYPFWDDLVVDTSASVHTDLLGSEPTRRFVIEWRNVRFSSDTTRRVDFEVVLHENGHILTQYRNLANDNRERGSSATVGIENESGTIALQHSFNVPVLGAPTFAVLYRLPPSGFVEGAVTDANDGEPVAGATVQAVQDRVAIRQVTTDATGHYRLHVPLGSYSVEVSKTNYGTESVAVTVDQEDQTIVRDFVLRTARGEVAPAALQFIVPPNQTRTSTLTLSNTGTLDMTWAVHETVGELAPADAGRVIRSWTPTGVSTPFGVGYTGNVWISDTTNDRNFEFTVAGAQTGRSWATPWVGTSPNDMAYDPGRDLMCQVNVGGDNGIHCWEPDTGVVVDSITGAFPWTETSQRGLAYRADNDTFYIGGITDEIIYQVKGLSYPDKGAVISQCAPPDGEISGLAYNSSFDVVWAATDTPTDTIYQLDPDTCTVLGTLAHPSPGSDAAGLEMDQAGNLWMVDQDPDTIYLVDSGVPAFQDVPWLTENPASGTLAPGASQSIEVRVDTAGLAPGVYEVTLFIVTNSGREALLRVPVELVVPGYYQAVDAGGSSYTDLDGDAWAADQGYTAGNWGYTAKSSHVADTREAIAGTDDDPLYQTLRQDPIEYRFDGIPSGVYEVDLRFAELGNRRPNSRIFDVIVEGVIVLPAHDIAGEVGTLTADQHVFFVPVTDGQLNVRFVTRRGFAKPIVNAIQVVHRPDR